MKVLFLYTELAGYFLACVKELSSVEGIQVHIVRWPVNKEAPFKFREDGNIKFYDRNEFDHQQLASLVRTIDPDVIYCSGWIDKGYLAAVKNYKRRIPVIVGFDNHWTGRLKQRVAALAAPFMIRRIFSHCWIPGEPQRLFAERMGFKKNEILTGFYSADVNLFSGLYTSSHKIKSSQFPHRFIYSGRYVSYKWVKELCEVFIEAVNETGADWELWCVGTGPEEKVQHEKIKHLGFIQPEEFSDIVSQTGVFILPSLSEPWGVVVHEFAAAGFPLICSSAVGAATEFVEEEKNGFIFSAGSKEQLRSLLIRTMNMNDASLLRMGEISHERSKRITPHRWVSQLMNLIRTK